MTARICGITLTFAIVSGLWSGAAQGRASGAAPQVAGNRSQWSGVYSDAQAKRGEPLYVQHCGFCHGADLQGTVSGPPLTAAALAAQWRGKTLADLFEYQQVFMPWTSPGGFARPQNVDILAYILKTGGLPAGADLPVEADAQRQIRMLEGKP